VIKLYREHILDHYRHPRNQGTLDDADISCEMDNPVCGDAVRLDVRLKDGRVSEARFSGRGCVISMASASMLTEEILGKTVEELRALQDEDVFNMMGITLGPVRAKCGLLSLRVLQEGLSRLEEAAPLNVKGGAAAPNHVKGSAATDA
jgi:nitrogen fixation NifU-like protein